MKASELCNYIKHYLDNDKTRSAIMLTGDWGTGKSYFIQNHLVPSIDTEAEKRCIVISLYGLKDIYEISKSIYLEVRARKLSSAAQSEAGAIGKFAAKTVLKGITSYFGIDLSASSDDFAQLFASIDLSNKLIILEDVERSQIDILELLGYVNNLVEQDNTKVLLVANESEIFTFTESEPDEKGNVKRIPTEHTLKYKKIREKTISDTLYFSTDLDSTLSNILSQFNIHQMLNVAKDSIQERIILSEIAMIMMDLENYNLRSFIFACQKTSDLFSNSTHAGATDFWKNVFYSVIAFSLRIKAGKISLWPDNAQISQKHGTAKYPLYKFAYEYIYFHSLDAEMLKTAEELYIQSQERYRRRNDPDLAVLYSFHEHPEAKVIEVVNNILTKLKANDVEDDQLGKIANHLIALKPVIGCHQVIDECKQLILQKIQNDVSNFSELSLFSSGLGISDQEARQEFVEFRSTITELFNKVKSASIMGFDYSPKSINDFSKAVQRDKGDILSNRGFACLFDMEKIRNMLPLCSSKNLQDFRAAFLSVYHFSNINEYYADDRPALEELLGIIKGFLEFSGYDNIQKLQIRFFIDNLEDILNRL